MPIAACKINHGFGVIIEIQFHGKHFSNAHATCIPRGREQ